MPPAERQTAKEEGLFILNLATERFWNLLNGRSGWKNNKLFFYAYRLQIKKSLEDMSD